jgi:hypothetical protein
MKVKVIGLKRWKGTVDGKAIDSGKLFVEVRLDDSRNTADALAKGYASEELKVAPEVVHRLEHLPLPFEAEVSTERVSNGRQSREHVTDVRPVELVKPFKAAA